MSKQAAQWFVLFEGTDESPIDQLECKFNAASGCEEEYVRKIERALSPTIRILAGPFPLNWAAAFPDPPEVGPEDAEAQLAADTYAQAADEMHWVDTGEVG